MAMLNNQMVIDFINDTDGFKQLFYCHQERISAPRILHLTGFHHPTPFHGVQPTVQWPRVKKRLIGGTDCIYFIKANFFYQAYFFGNMPTSWCPIVS